MRRADSLPVYVPTFSAEWMLDPSKMDVNLRNFDYVVRTAIPRLDELVISSFEDTAKAAAKKEGGFLTRKLGDVTLNVESRKEERTSYCTVLEDFAWNLANTVFRNVRGYRADGVIRSDDDVYVSIDMIIEDLEHLKEENTSAPNTRYDLSLLGADGQELALDRDVECMSVSFDRSQYADLSAACAAKYQTARSLKARLVEFKKLVKDALRAGYSSEDDSGSKAYDFEMDDGSGARLLFYDKNNFSYGKIFWALMRETKEPSFSTGDLRLIRSRAFDLPFHKSRKGKEISFGCRDSTDSFCVFDIERRSGEDVQESSYRVHRNNHAKLYVHVSDVQGAMDSLYKRNHDSSRELKVDFFPSHVELGSI